MHIGIDCRFWGTKNTGLGRYTKELVSNLLKIDKENSYTLFLRKQDYCGLQVTDYESQDVKLIQADFPHYSFKEQLLMPGLIKKARLDLIHFPHFNIPLFCPTRFVVTIHDLIKNQFKNNTSSTHNYFFYKFKYLNYQLVIKKAIKNSSNIIVPSKFVKKQILRVSRIDASKIKVIYEGAAEVFSQKTEVNKEEKESVLGKYRLKRPFLLYVGNLYFHKNIVQLIKVMKKIKTTTQKLKLVIVGEKGLGYKELLREIKRLKLEGKVVFTGFVKDEELKILYQQALAFVTPSLMEGFGLPGLEALASGGLVISSNQGSLPEIYKDAVFYFNPRDQGCLEKEIKKVIVLTGEERQRLIKKGQRVAAGYSWEKCARQTLELYENSLKI